jgi:AbiV family abortive infection protein
LKFGNIEIKNQYSGQLSTSQISQGINLARANGKRLAVDARLLLENKRYPSAAALAILAIEETGKELILREFSFLKHGEKTASYWKKFRGHLHKNKAWILPLLVSNEPNSTIASLVRAIFDEDSDHSELLDKVKQVAFYVDCVGTGVWQSPSDELDELHATKVVEIAEAMQGTDRIVTEEEIIVAQEIVAAGVTPEKIKAYTERFGVSNIIPLV